MALTTQADVASKALVEIGEESVTATDLTNNTLNRARVINQLYDITLDEVLADTYWEFAKKVIALSRSNPQPLSLPEPDIFSDAFDLPPNFIRPVRVNDDERFDIFAHFATIAVQATTLSSVGTTVDFSGAHGLSVGEFINLDSGSQEDEIREVATVVDSDTVTLVVAFTANQAAGTSWTRAAGEKLYLVTESDEAVLEYISRVTTPIRWSPLFTEAFTKRLSSKLAMSIAHSRDLSISLFQEYVEILNRAEVVSGQSANRPKKIESRGLINVRLGAMVRPDKVINT